MNEPIEIRVWVLGQFEPTVFSVENSEQAYALTVNLLKEARKPFNEYLTIQGDSGYVFINPRFITMVKSSVPLVIKDEDTE